MTRSQVHLLSLLVLTNVVSVMDRTAFSITAPLIKAELQLSDSAIGALAGIAFSLFYAIGAIPLARLSDRQDRRLILVFSIAAWSTVTAVTSAASNLWQLAMARIGVAVGEAGATPASHALIADRIPEKQQALAFAIHSAGSPVGLFAGLTAGGYFAAEFGWRTTFILLAVPGFLLSAFLYFGPKDREPIKGAPAALDNAGTVLPDILHLISDRSRALLYVGMGFGAFAMAALSQWLPTYFVRAFDLSTAQIGPAFGTTFGVGSVLGMLAGGYFSGKLGRSDDRNSLRLASISYVIATPLAFSVGLAPTFNMAILFVFLLSCSATIAYGPVFAIIVNSAPPRLRALSSAISLFAATLVGGGLGPWVVGMLSDWFGPATSAVPIRQALMCAFALMPIPALLYWIASLHAKGQSTGARLA